MNLVIRAQTLNDQPISQAIVGCFDRKGGTIGRSDTNTMTLPDTERRISRLQAEIHGSDSGFSIRNVGSTSAILLNDAAIAPGDGRDLSDGDSLRVGGYALQVSIDAENPTARMITDGRAVIDARAVIVGSVVEVRTHPPVASPRGGRSAAVGDSNPFADLFGSAPAASPSNDPFSFLAKPTSDHRPPSTPDRREAPPSKLPDDFDPFAVLDAPPPSPAGSPRPPVGSADVLGLVGAHSAPVSSLDQAFDLGPASSPADADPMAAFLAGGAPTADFGGLMSSGPSVDPLAMFGDDASWQKAGPAAFDHTPELQGAYRPPSIVEPKKPPVAPPARSVPEPKAPVDDPFAGLGLAPSDGTDALADFLAASPVRASAPAPAAGSPPPLRPKEIPEAVVHVPAPPAPRAADPPPIVRPQLPASSVTGPSTDALWAAFCEGTRVPLPLPQGLDAEQMRMLGMLVREAVDGAVRLMALRALTKTELRAAVTVIRARNNNPLKFSPDCDAALTQMLQPPLRGFMPGPLAMQDAMHDLLGHSIGTMAGMKAAMAGVLARFEPAQLEAKLAEKTMLDSLIPGARKAKLWDLYLQHAEAIRLEAQEDFHKLFGEAFVAAYEEQLDQLQPPHG